MCVSAETLVSSTGWSLWRFRGNARHPRVGHSDVSAETCVITLYEKMVELDVPAMVHVSSSCNLSFHATGAHYINADTTAFMQFLIGDLFADFPT